MGFAGGQLFRGELPGTLVGTVEYLAELRGWSPEEARDTVWANFEALTAP